jgi:hypothetical protein
VWRFKVLKILTLTGGLYCIGFINPVVVVVTPCGGELEYLLPASSKRRQKGNPFSNEKMRYGPKFCETWTRE